MWATWGQRVRGPRRRERRAAKEACRKGRRVHHAMAACRGRPACRRPRPFPTGLTVGGCRQPPISFTTLGCATRLRMDASLRSAASPYVCWTYSSTRAVHMQYTVHSCDIVSSWYWAASRNPTASSITCLRPPRGALVQALASLNARVCACRGLSGTADRAGQAHIVLCHTRLAVHSRLSKHAAPSPAGPLLCFPPCLAPSPFPCSLRSRRPTDKAPAWNCLLRG